jgi:hypothetical protein
MMRVNIASLEFLMTELQRIALAQDLVLDRSDSQATCFVMGLTHCFVSPQSMLYLIMETSFFPIQTSLKFARNWKNLSQSY